MLGLPRMCGGLFFRRLTRQVCVCTEPRLLTRRVCACTEPRRLLLNARNPQKNANRDSALSQKSETGVILKIEITESERKK